MSENRLKTGKARYVPIYGSGIRVHKVDSVSEALRFAQMAERSHGKKDRLPDHLWSEALSGNKGLALQVERADPIIDEAIVIDPRLSKRHGWVRAEEGVDACPALVSEGEPACCLDRRRMRLAEASGMDPIRIVISTDSNGDASVDNLLAFIAAARLAQQFRPLEIWWQGAWLCDEKTDREAVNHGEVVLAPLVRGDMDFARVQFFLSNKFRDYVSFYFMRYYSRVLVPPKVIAGKARRQGYPYSGVKADYSFLENTTFFLSEKKMDHSPEGVARMAARWAGMDPSYLSRISDYSAEQYWQPKTVPTVTPKSSKADEDRWEREAAERRKELERQQAADNRRRMAVVE